MKAYIFPGQGAQFPGMGKDLYESNDIARKLFEKPMTCWGLIFPKLCLKERKKN